MFVVVAAVVLNLQEDGLANAEVVTGLLAAVTVNVEITLAAYVGV